MFRGDYEQDAPWSTESLRGCKRFLDRVERLAYKVVDGDNYSKEAESLIHKSIKKIEYDMDHMGYNTSISTLMILANKFDEMESITKEDYHVLLTLLNPFAPHMTEELNEALGYKPICESAWPKYDEAKTVESTVTIGVQVNGKVRGEITINDDMQEDEIKELAYNIDNVKKFIEGKEIVKTIIIPKRIVNIVVK